MIRTVAGAYPDQWWAYDDETPELTGLGNTEEEAIHDLREQQDNLQKSAMELGNQP